MYYYFRFSQQLFNVGTIIILSLSYIGRKLAGEVPRFPKGYNHSKRHDTMFLLLGQKLLNQYTLSSSL